MLGSEGSDLLAGDAQTLGTQLVPAGIYTKIMGHLQSLQAGGGLSTAFPELVGATVLLEGDIAGDGGGHFLDPRVTDNDQAIRQAIRHAIKVGIDADKDGEPDDDLESETD